MKGFPYGARLERHTAFFWTGESTAAIFGDRWPEARRRRRWRNERRERLSPMAK